MNIESLKYFIYIEKYNSYSLAAEKLCISQSSLSKHIKKLESELNCVLFIRCTRHITLTASGETLKKYAEEILSNYNELLLDIHKLNSDTPTLSIGYIPVINQYNIAYYMGLFQKNYNDIHFNLQEGEYEETLDALLKHKIDFAFLRNDILNDSDLDITPLAEDELVIIVPKNHPLSKKKYVSLAELSNEKFISLGKHSGVYNLFINQCNKALFSPNIVCFNSRIENIIGLVSAGIGISPLMRKSVECFDKNNVNIVLLKEKIQSHLCLVHLKNKTLSPIETNFKQYLIDSCKNNLITTT